MIVRTIGVFKMSKNDVVRIDLCDGNEVIVEQFDPATNSEENPSSQFISIPQRYLPQLVRLLQEAMQRANVEAAH